MRKKLSFITPALAAAAAAVAIIAAPTAAAEPPAAPPAAVTPASTDVSAHVVPAGISWRRWFSRWWFPRWRFPRWPGLGPVGLGSVGLGPALLTVSPTKCDVASIGQALNLHVQGRPYLGHVQDDAVRGVSVGVLSREHAVDHHLLGVRISIVRVFQNLDRVQLCTGTAQAAGEVVVDVEHREHRFTAGWPRLGGQDRVGLLGTGRPGHACACIQPPVWRTRATRDRRRCRTARASATINQERLYRAGQPRPYTAGRTSQHSRESTPV